MLNQNATLNVAPGLTNDGTILLESQNGTYSDTLSTPSGTFTNDADGIIQVTAGTGGTRSITGNLTNLGAIDVGAGTVLTVNNTSTAATFLNEAQVTVDPAGIMYVSQTYNAGGGTISGPGYVFNGTLVISVSTASPTTILVDGGTTLASNNLPNTTIWVQGNAVMNQNATLNVAPGLKNDGTILLESQGGTYSDTLSTPSGTFTNDADGIIQVTAGTGGTRSITGNLTNLGAIDVGAGTVLTVNNTSTAATFLNEAQVTVDPAGIMYVSQTYNAGGGTISGPGYVFNGTLVISVSTASPTTILVDGGTTLASNNLPNTTIWVQGNAVMNQNATLNVAPGLKNDGTILLESQGGTYSDTLSTPSGTFTNDADGIINVVAGTGGARSISGGLTNAGTVNFDTNTTLGVAGANLANSGLMSIAGATVTVVGSTFTNGVGGLVSGYGTFNTSGVTLNDTGGTVQALGGTLNLTNSGLVSSGTLGVGTWVVGPSSTLSISGVSSISTLSANVTLQGSGATFTGLSSLSKITAAAELELSGGTSFTSAGNLDNAGTIDLAPGTLNVAGTYTQESAGAYDVAIGGTTPGSSYGQLNVSQSASLNGSLSVNLINNYAPPQGDSYQVLTFASETGNFSAEFGLYLGGGEGFSPTFSPSTNPTALDLAVIAEAAGTQTTVQSSENPSNYGDTVTFTATVAPTVSTYLVPTGQVTFYEGSTAVDTATLVNGSATYVTSTLPGGNDSITAQYSGDSNFSGSTSTALTQTVNPIASQTALQSSDNPSNYGDSVTFTATVSPLPRPPGIATPDRRSRVLRRLDAPRDRDFERRHGLLHHVVAERGCQSTDRGEVPRRLRLQPEQSHDPADDQRPNHDHVEHHNSPHRRRLGHTR